MTGLRRDAEALRQRAAVPELAVPMGQHLPEAPQCLRGQAEAETGNVAFQIGTDESLPPLEGNRLVRRQKAVGETAAQPEPAHCRRCRGHFADGQRRHFQIADAAGQRFRRSVDQRRRGRSQQQKAAGTALLVDQGAQQREEVLRQLNLIEDHQLVAALGQVKFGVGDAGEIRRAFEIQIGGARPSGGDLLRQGRLAHLARSGQGDDGKPIQGGNQLRLDMALNSLNHPCNLTN